MGIMMTAEAATTNVFHKSDLWKTQVAGGVMHIGTCRCRSKLLGMGVVAPSSPDVTQNRPCAPTSAKSWLTRRVWVRQLSSTQALIVFSL